MDVQELAEGRYLNAAHVVKIGGQFIGMISNVSVGQFMGAAGPEKKVLIDFSESHLVLPLNKGNLRAVIASLGSNTDGWKGSQIRVTVVAGEYKKQVVPSMKVEARPLIPLTTRSTEDASRPIYAEPDRNQLEEQRQRRREYDFGSPPPTNQWANVTSRDHDDDMSR